MKWVVNGSGCVCVRKCMHVCVRACVHAHMLLFVAHRQPVMFLIVLTRWPRQQPITTQTARALKRSVSLFVIS